MNNTNILSGIVTQKKRYLFVRYVMFDIKLVRTLEGSKYWQKFLDKGYVPLYIVNGWDVSLTEFNKGMKMKK